MTPPPADRAALSDLPMPALARNLAMVALLCASFLSALDTTIANTALPQIAIDLGASEASIIWVANAYQIATMATLLPFASMGESLGYKRVYVAGVALFAIASAICGEAPTLWMLVAGRALQGIGGAAMMSVSLAVIRQCYPAHMLGRGLGLNALLVAVGFTLGPVVASGILSIATWHWLFLVNIPIGVTAILLALRYLPAGVKGRSPFEWGPAVLCAAVLGLLSLSLCSLNGGGAAPAAVGLVLAAVCLVALLRVQRHHPAPMLAIDLLRIRLLRLSSLTSICAFSTQSAAMVALPFFLQGTLGVSVVHTGFFIAAWPLVVGTMAVLIAPLTDRGRYSAGLLCSIGLAILTVGLCVLALTPADASAPGIFARLAFCGLGFGFFQAPNLREIMSNAPPHRSGGASGLVAISRLGGQTIGAALVAQCFHRSPDGAPVVALWIGGGIALVGCAVSAMRLRQNVSRPAAHV